MRLKVIVLFAIHMFMQHFKLNFMLVLNGKYWYLYVGTAIDFLNKCSLHCLLLI